VGEGRAGGSALSPALLQSSNGVSGVVPEEWERRDTRVRAGPWPAAPLLAVAPSTSAAASQRRIPAPAAPADSRGGGGSPPSGCGCRGVGSGARTRSGRTSSAAQLKTGGGARESRREENGVWG